MSHVTTNHRTLCVHEDFCNIISSSSGMVLCRAQHAPSGAAVLHLTLLAGTLSRVTRPGCNLCHLKLVSYSDATGRHGGCEDGEFSACAVLTMQRCNFVTTSYSLDICNPFNQSRVAGDRKQAGRCGGTISANACCFSRRNLTAVTQTSKNNNTGIAPSPSRVSLPANSYLFAPNDSQDCRLRFGSRSGHLG